MNKGKVWLVGAGPGDADLLTIKAKKIIEQAEVVVYDSLVGQGILLKMPANAECIDVGKRAGNHTKKQDEINQILLDEALKGKRVVRLKGGDPFLFGRGGEELELLKQHNIPYEIVPGITSAIAVPAYQGIPVTHRDYCSSVHIITGHKGQDKDYDIDFEALVRTKGTLIFLMGVAALGDICSNLIRSGMEPDMPAAILAKGTTSKQKRIVATVSTLVDAVKENAIETPAIIVVGKVCQLADEFAWFDQLPLAGNKILITRPRELASTLSEKLREKGAEVLELPAIKIVPKEENSKLKDAISRLNQYQWLVLTSPSGADIFFQALKQENIDIRQLWSIKIAVIGEGTKKKVEERGILVDLMPEYYDGKALGHAIGEQCKEGDRILIPRAEIGNQELITEITKVHPVFIDDIPTYATVYEQQEIVDIVSEFRNGTIDYAMFTSASTVKGFVEATPGLDYGLVQAICIGKQTMTEAEKYNMQTYMSKEATMDSLVQVVEELVEQRREN